MATAARSASLRAAAAPRRRLGVGEAVAAGVVALGLGSALLAARAVADWRFGAGLVIGLALIAAVALPIVTLIARRRGVATGEADRALVRALLDAGPVPLALTDRSGRLLAANRAYTDQFGADVLPSALADDPALAEAVSRAAWRDGHGVAEFSAHRLRLSATRAGGAENHLLWRIEAPRGDTRAEVARLVEAFGDRLGRGGVMAVLVDEFGRVLAANRVFAARALGDASGACVGRDLAALVEADAGDGQRLRLTREPQGRDPLRLLHMPIDPGEEGAGASMLMLFDDPQPDAADAETPVADVEALLAMLPLGLALADREGRFLFVNPAFARAAGSTEAAPPLYPGDLVVKEDKAAVADAVRRIGAMRDVAGAAQGTAPAYTADVAIRLAVKPDEPVSLGVAPARGFGPATVILSLKASGEESKLKRQVTQANKMQAVGQLAGGIAHDFNNILTALIGHCDLMLMRHTPGDSDYEDIHQIRHNANRAAGLTRQLLAFSRQQTLRPQVLQLPDVVSEVSHLLKRLLGDATRLEISHGRALGAVRADPGQLEQVIVNLAVNARDAMPDGGTITVRTYGVAAAAVRHLGPDILPPGDYTALSVTDTGTGIAPADLPKIFEPFFTTKEVGKGTGLGLSTVYGIVKQSGGFIFADSELGRGTSFVIYLPVFAGALAEAVPDEAKAAPPALWGSGRILIVEDEDMVRSVAERALARQGYQVATAANGEEALEALDAAIAAGEAFDLVVSDVMMPVMDGPTMVAEARVKLPALPVLFMSGYAEEQLRKSIAIDNVSFLPKPFSVQQLAEATRDALAAAHEGRAAD